MRTDVHRPGFIEPNKYKYLLGYVLGDKKGFNGWNILQLHTFLVAGQSVFGVPGKCGVCGVRFVMGELWQHENGELLHVGHVCAQKYELFSHDPGFNAAKDMKRRAHVAHQTKLRNDAAREKLFLNNPGLDDALKLDHHVVKDIAQRIATSPKSVSQNAVNLVFKIAKRLEERSKQEPERLVQAPIGRQTITGKIVSKKAYEGSWGHSTKITVKVETPEGNWLCWGTMPDALFGSYSSTTQRIEANVGDTVTFRATLQSTDKPHFSFFKRPTGAQLIEKAKAA